MRHSAIGAQLFSIPMALVAQAEVDERASPYFKEYERIAMAWEHVARKLNGTVAGTYNAYHFHAEIKCLIRNQAVSITGRREMMPPAFKLGNSRIVGRTIIHVQLRRREEGSWFTIRPRSYLDRILSMRSRSVGYSSNGAFVIKARDPGLLDWIMGKRPVIDDLIELGLRSAVLTAKGKLKIDLDNLLESEGDLSKGLRPVEVLV